MLKLEHKGFELRLIPVEGSDCTEDQFRKEIYDRLEKEFMVSTPPPKSCILAFAVTDAERADTYENQVELCYEFLSMMLAGQGISREDKSERRLALHLTYAYDVFKEYLLQSQIPFNKANREMVVLVISTDSLEQYGDILKEHTGQEIASIPSPLDDTLCITVVSAQMLEWMTDKNLIAPSKRGIQLSDADLMLAGFVHDAETDEVEMCLGVFDCNEQGLV